MNKPSLLPKSVTMAVRILYTAQKVVSNLREAHQAPSAGDLLMIDVAQRYADIAQKLDGIRDEDLMNLLTFIHLKVPTVAIMYTVLYGQVLPHYADPKFRELIHNICTPNGVKVAQGER